MRFGACFCELFAVAGHLVIFTLHLCEICILLIKHNATPNTFGKSCLCFSNWNLSWFKGGFKAVLILFN